MRARTQARRQASKHLQLKLLQAKGMVESHLLKLHVQLQFLDLEFLKALFDLCLQPIPVTYCHDESSASAWFLRSQRWHRERKMSLEYMPEKLHCLEGQGLPSYHTPAMQKISRRLC
jgi:hypothetical protein